MPAWLTCHLRTSRLEHDIVSLPLAGFARGVHQRRPLTINRAGLPIGIGRILERIEHLNFIAALEKNPAIAATLAVAVNLPRAKPIRYATARHRISLCGDLAGSLGDFEVSVLHFPFRGRSVFRRYPVREILAVEQHDRVGRRASGRRAGSHNRRTRARRIVNMTRQARAAWACRYIQDRDSPLGRAQLPPESAKQGRFVSSSASYHRSE